ncbi:MAG: M1 family aminopeptidase [Polyangiaceae bacterium]|nr:M1 family aminopeptidase [Polyangiaceae bacterium]
MQSPPASRYACSVQRQRFRQRILILLGMLALGWAGSGQGRPLAPATPIAPATPVVPIAPVAPIAPETPMALEAPLRVASYNLDANLDVGKHTIHATGTIHFTNRSTRALTELWFHLYLNAFKNNRSLFLRNPFALGRSGRTLSSYGYIEVHKLTSPRFGTQNLWANSAKHSPADPDDTTDISVPLPAPLEPGESLELELEFTSHLPPVLERTGYAGSFHFAGQWFPKLAKLELDGTFAHFPFHPNAEFYADFGDYDVRITAPNEFVIGATGSLVETTQRKNSTTSHFSLKGAHDFAFTAWDKFERISEKVGDVHVQLLFPAWQRENALLSLSAVRQALPNFSRRFGPYPYPTLTVVHPPEAGEGAGGMEYPSLITTGGVWFEPYLGSHAIEAVTVHELGHQWFYGLLASNESEAPFLDEGVNSYAEIGVLEDLLGVGSAFRGAGLDISIAALHRVNAAWYGGDDVVAQPARGFRGFSAMGGLVYSRTATLLLTLERVFGPEKFRAALKLYAEKFRFGHPTPDDFVTTLEKELEPSFGRALRVGLFERGWVDYRVESVASRRSLADLGLFAEGGPQSSRASAASGSKDWLGRAVVYRRGNLEIPVEIALHLKSGAVLRRKWNGQGASFVVDYTGPSELASVEVDPDLKIPLDQNLLNNSKAVTPAGESRISYILTSLAHLFVSGALP